MVIKFSFVLSLYLSMHIIVSVSIYLFSRKNENLIQNVGRFENKFKALTLDNFFQSAC